VLGGIFTLLLSSLLAAGTVEVRSAVPCPSTVDVNTRLQPLLPRVSAEPTERHLATLDVVEQSDGRKALHVRLLRSDGSVIGDRHLLVAGDCQAMAEAAAVVIAAWETEDPSSLPAPVVESAAPPAPGAVESPSWQLLGGAGVGAGFLGGIALVGNVEAQVGRSTSRWRLRLSLMRELDRSLDLGTTGHADWHHTMAALGLVLHGSVGAWVGSLDLGPTLGWVTVKGSGFQENQESQSLEYGVVGGARGGLRLGRWTLWIEGRANAWLRGQRALLTNNENKVAEMRRADVSASAGTTFLFF
jgi:hypothetical protein